jgi:threonine synthase
MITQEGGNVTVLAVKGNFDDAQTGVKRIFNDTVYNEELHEDGFKLSSANSINWGRLVPQIVYYFSAYADLVKKGTIAVGDKVNFVVPTGNFGNILAGYYAKRMGLPVNKFVCASNANNVLTDFLRTGVYDRNRTFHKTASPSMDILISSNLERLLYHVTDGNDAQVALWMQSLNETGRYDVGAEVLAKIQELFWADYADDETTLANIRKVFDETHYTMDTHTSVAEYVANTYRTASGDADTVNVILSTASPYKFNQSVLEALVEKDTLEGKDEFAMLDCLAEISGLIVPPALASLKTAPIRHTTVCAKEEMPEVVKAYLKK